jgi:catechol 2,3-dioxygenase-like lactoylglutathione lyase family enzyme
MVLAGLAFKISAVPFHQWTPDVYEGAPTPLTGFMAAATKAVAFAALLRVVLQALPAQADEWQPALATLAILSLVFGNVVALVQTNVKRMLAYSSVGHAGYLLTAVVAASELGSSALLFYLAVYTAMTIGAFAAVAAREREIGGPVTLDSLRGWGFARPYMAGVMALSLLSLAGFPLTGGFLAKLVVWQAAIDAGYTYLAVVGVAATAISLGYYLRVGFALFDRREGLESGPGPPPGTGYPDGAGGGGPDRRRDPVARPLPDGRDRLDARRGPVVRARRTLTDARHDRQDADPRPPEPAGHGLRPSAGLLRGSARALGLRVLHEPEPGLVGFGTPGNDDFYLATGDRPARVHLAFGAADRAAVDAFHAAALGAGGTDNGAPGLRPAYHPDYYGAYVLDPDGNNVEAVCHTPPAAP